MKTIKPPRLKKGDTIGIISPASTPLDLERINLGILYLEKLGYKVKEGLNIRKGYGYLAGTDEERLNDLHDMFTDKNIKAIICTRGGYGTPRLLSKINYQLIKKNPKILVGYSDITALQLAIFKKTGIITFSGPMLAVEMFKDFDAKTEEFFWKILTSNKKIGKIENPDGIPFIGNKKGTTSGVLLGGNLALTLSLFGTPFSPNYNKSIILLEDVDEEPYRVDRLFSQLSNSNTFKKVVGIIFGEFTDCYPKDPTKPSLSLDQVFTDYFENINIPIIKNVRYGHIPKKITFPIGIKVKINANKNTIEFIENAVT